MTEATYIAVSEKQYELKGKRRFSVSGVLNETIGRFKIQLLCIKGGFLPTSRNEEMIQIKIKEIHDESHQNYGAPKITKELRKEGIKISERTAGRCMKEMRIKAQYVKPYNVTTKDSDFSSELVNVLDEQFNPEHPNAAWCTDITYMYL